VSQASYKPGLAIRAGYEPGLASWLQAWTCY